MNRTREILTRQNRKGSTDEVPTHSVPADAERCGDTATESTEPVDQGLDREHGVWWEYRHTAGIWAARIVVLAILLLSWELFSNPPGSRFTLVKIHYVSEPSDIYQVLSRWVSDGSLEYHTWITVQEALLGFCVGAALGLGSGFVLGVFRTVDRIFRPFVTMLYSVPRLALAPLFLVWFGLGMSSKIALVAVIVFFLVFMNTLNGVRNVDTQLVDIIRVMGASRWKVHRVVTLPAAMTWIISGLSMSVPFALVGAVTGEMIASNRGLGYLLIRSSGQFNIAGVFAAIVVMVALSMVLNLAVTAFERWALRWQEETH